MTGLRAQAATDLQAFLGDSVAGFGNAITVTAPSGASKVITGFSTDISLTIDPSTGQQVMGRAASVALPMAAILGSVPVSAMGGANSVMSGADQIVAPGFGMLPKGIDDKKSNPWRVSFADALGKVWEFKVTEAIPDRAIGCLVLMLDAYKP